MMLLPGATDTDEQKLGIQSVLSAPPTPPVLYVPEEKKNRWQRLCQNRRALLRQAWQCAAVLLLSVAAYFLITRHVMQMVEVVGQSMLPTLKEHQRYLLDRWTLAWREPRRNEMVVLKDPQDNGLSVKRVIGLPGESVYIKQGRVFVNFRELKEPYLPAGTRTFVYSHLKEQLVACGRNHFFVLGDNRSVSVDSRAYGPVARQNLLGVLVCRTGG